MTLADLAWAVEDVRKRLAGYALFRAYDAGEHRLTFATEKYRNTFGDLFREFADNMCDDLVDHMTDRLQVTGWTSPDSQEDAGQSGERNGGLTVVQDDVADLAATAWERSRGTSRMGGVFRNAFREGDGFTISQVGADGRAYTFRQRPEQMAVRYSSDNPDELELAAKVWREQGRYRVTLYYPDGSLERYATKGLGAQGGLPQARAFQPMAVGDPALRGEDPMAAEGTRPGLGVFHFPNGEVSEYGRSMLAKVIPLQDALNKSVADMLVAMEFHAYPQRYATGVQIEYNPDGTERQPFAAGEGRMWRVGAKDANLGQFDPASMDGFLDVQDAFRLEIARKGAMPAHLVNLRNGGTPPTGVAMLVAEGRAVKMARDRQRDWGYTLREQQAYNLRLEGRNVEADDLAEQWAPPETRDMKALLEELAMKVDLGVPIRQALLEMGYSPAEVTGFLNDAEAEGEALEAARAVASGGRRQVTVGQARDLGLPGAPEGDGQTNPLAS